MGFIPLQPGGARVFSLLAEKMESVYAMAFSVNKKELPLEKVRSSVLNVTDING